MTKKKLTLEDKVDMCYKYIEDKKFEEHLECYRKRVKKYSRKRFWKILGASLGILALYGILLASIFAIWIWSPNADLGLKITATICIVCLGTMFSIGLGAIVINEEEKHTLN